MAAGNKYKNDERINTILSLTLKLAKPGNEALEHTSKKGIEGDEIDSIIAGLITLEKKLNVEEVAAKKKVYKIIVECLENISRHTEMPTHALRPSLFVLGKHEGCYHVISGNYIFKAQADSVRSMLDNINKLDPETIRKKYREVLSEGKLTQKGGAGLGMIDIIQKSGNKLEYDFIPSGEDVYFFMIKAQVSGAK